MNGTDIEGETNATLALINVQPPDSGTYRLVVTNACGTNASASADLTLSPIIISPHPQSLVQSVGYNVAFSGGALGVPSISYQWCKDSVPIAGATNTSYSIANVQCGDAGAYTLVASNVNGSVTSSNAVLTVFPAYTFAAFAGLSGISGTNDGWANTARFNRPHGVAVDHSGTVYVAEIGNYTIRKITPDGTVSTLAGLAGSGGTNDGIGSTARFDWPWGIAVDNAHNVFVADESAQTIREITPDGTVTTLAGLARASGSADGTNDTARFSSPAAVTADAAGNLYVAEYSGAKKIRFVTPKGVVTTIAGAGSGYGDGSTNAAQFQGPVGIGVDSSGNIYVADQQNNSIRKITHDGIVLTLAGLGGKNFLDNAGSNDGIGTQARFFAPHGAAVDSSGNIYVPDMNNYTIRRVTSDGVVSTVGGLPGVGGNNDGVGNAARFSGVRGVAVDAAGNLYVADFNNHTIRKGVPFTVTNLPQSQAVIPGASVTLSVGAAGAGPYFYQWLSNGVAMAGQTGTTFSVGQVWRTNSGIYSVVVSNNVGNSIRLDAVVRALVPPVFQSLQFPSNGIVRLTFQDSDGGVPYDLSQVVLQWRTNLPAGADTNWQSITSGFYVTNGSVVIDDTNIVAFPRRFYRILER